MSLLQLSQELFKSCRILIGDNIFGKQHTNLSNAFAPFCTFAEIIKFTAPTLFGRKFRMAFVPTKVEAISVQKIPFDGILFRAIFYRFYSSCFGELPNAKKKKERQFPANVF